MGGSTNTILHLLAAAQEAEVDFTMADIDRLSKRVPNVCKVAPATEFFHVEDVHRAGGVIGILGELDRGGLIKTAVSTVHEATLGDAIAKYDVATNSDEKLYEFFLPGPAGLPSQRASIQPAPSKQLLFDSHQGSILSVH